jgi:uncharacterized protein
MKKDFNLTQPQRLAALFIDLLVVGFACTVLFGIPYPPLGDKGFWAYSALLSVLVGSKLITPFYVKPVDAISYAVPALISLMLINRWEHWPSNQKWMFSLAAAFSLFIVVLAMSNIAINALESEWAKRASNQLRVILDLIGHPKFVYTPLIFFAIYSFHTESWPEAVAICMVTITTVWWSLGDFAIGAYYRLKRAFAHTSIESIAGRVIAYQEPGIVLLRQHDDVVIPKNALLYVCDRHGPKKLVVALGYVGRSEGILVRTVELTGLSTPSQSLIGATPLDDCAYHLDDDVIDAICLNEGVTRDAQSAIVGLVAPDASIGTLYFEVIDNSDLEEGRLVTAIVGKNKVMYQIVAGLTKEEIVQQKNTYGYLRGQAQQIGIWDTAREKFLPCNWLPALNTPVYLERKTDYEINSASVGHFPESNFQTKIKSVSDLVTHNTAILGILGIGKSMLGIELLERMMAQGIKVICLDLTNQYANELADFYDANYEKSCLQKLRAASETDRDHFEDNPNDGGSRPNLEHAILEDLQDFLDDQNPRRLKIYNPSEFVASKQQREPSSYTVGGSWQRGAALYSVTPVEITQMITEAALLLLSQEMSSTARVCLVFEEAHSLIPEWNSVVNDADRHATSGTARAILQGRKYGLGCLLITQRTANVTKTILNQCNTVFAMRTFDDTGKEFLANYIGHDYAKSLSSIPERHAVFFGKASSCENPVLIRLNDRDDFRRAFRPMNPPPALLGASPPPPPPPAPPAPPPAPQDVNEDFDDDIPF